MRLAVVTNIMTPYRLPLLEALRDRLGELHVLLMAEREENRDWQLRATSLECQVLPGWHVRRPGSEVSVHINYGVWRALRRIRPDVILSGGFAPANLAAWSYCRANRCAFVGWGELSAQDIAGTSPLQRAVRHLMSRWSRGAIASSGEAAAVFRHYGVARDAILVAPMPVDVESFRSAAAQWRGSPWWHAQRARYGGPILLSLGRLAARKGYPELFAIYEQVLRRVPDASLLVVGDGPERASLERQVSAHAWKRVHFLGFQQAGEVARFLALADVFVFHTLSDPFGAVLSEAMAAGLPVVASVHAAATRELIEHGVNGMCIDPRDTAAAATTLLQVLKMQPQERAALGAAAYATVQQYDIAATSTAMAGFLRAACAPDAVRNSHAQPHAHS